MITEQERKAIRDSIKIMYQLATGKDPKQFGETLSSKSDDSIIAIFFHYKSKLKDQKIVRSKNTVLSEELYIKIRNILEQNRISLVKKQKKTIMIRDQEDLDIIYFLEGLCLDDFCAEEIPRTIGFFDPQSIERISSQELDEILAVCCYYQLTRIGKNKSGQDLSQLQKEEINKWTQKVRYFFPCITDYYAILIKYPKMREWVELSEKDRFNRLINILQPYLHKLSLDERKKVRIRSLKEE